MCGLSVSTYPYLFASSGTYHLHPQKLPGHQGSLLQVAPLEQGVEPDDSRGSVIVWFREGL